MLREIAEALLALEAIGSTLSIVLLGGYGAPDCGVNSRKRA